MTQTLLHALNGLPHLLIVGLLSAAPVSELRGGIPVGLLLYKLPLWHVWIVAVIANIVVVAPIVAGFEWLTNTVEKKPLVGGVLRWAVHHARSRQAMVEKYGMVALTFWCALPLPGAGAWTACLLGPLVGMRFWRTMLCIALGVMIASGIVTGLTLGGVFAVHAVG